MPDVQTGSQQEVIHQKTEVGKDAEEVIKELEAKLSEAIALLAEREGEIVRLRASIKDGDFLIASREKVVTHLESKLTAAEQDAGRLDWLDTCRHDITSEERDSHGEWCQILIGHGWSIEGQCSSVREAIDAAMAAPVEQHPSIGCENLAGDLCIREGSCLCFGGSDTALESSGGG
ncbi:hypothetical protein [Parahaliea mediterranea]|uniref:hypothetical protein n=1 Tax=Parahaliea mediterranea TaxID=651086 RepID=UPI001300246E|nr:hypothetical protein [Parahaliea mediterranea]